MSSVSVVGHCARPRGAFRVQAEAYADGWECALPRRFITTLPWHQPLDFRHMEQRHAKYTYDESTENMRCLLYDADMRLIQDLSSNFSGCLPRVEMEEGKRYLHYVVGMGIKGKVLLDSTFSFSHPG